MPLRAKCKFMPKSILAGVCVSLLLLYLLSNLSSSYEPSITREVIERPDSALVRIDRSSPSVRVNSRLVPRDSLLTLDTIVNDDALHVSVAPDSTIQIRLLPAPRLVQEWVRFMRRDSIIRVSVCKFVSRPWYESPLLVIAGAILGFLIAILF